MNRLLQSLFDVPRLVRALGYTRKGLVAAYRGESAFRQELILAIVLLPLGAWLGQNGVERSLLMGSVVLVLVVELLNSAIEAVVDRGGKERNRLAGQAKDMGSAAVFMALLLLVLTWTLILWERFAG